MVLSGCHSFSDTCSEKQLPYPLLLGHLFTICPLLPRLTSGPFSFRDPDWFLIPKTAASCVLSRLLRGSQDGDTDFGI